MTVKEVEERTGLPRANIRYYESEGLIHPVRYGRDGVSQRQLERLIDHLQEFPYLPLAWEGEGVSVDYRPKVRGYNKDVISMSPRPAAEEYLVEAEFFVSLERDV